MFMKTIVRIVSCILRLVKRISNPAYFIYYIFHLARIYIPERLALIFCKSTVKQIKNGDAFI